MKAIRFWRRFWTRLTSWLPWNRRAYQVAYVGEVPDVFEPRILYLVGEGCHTWQASVVCPGGCGHIMQLNMQPDTRPRWSLVINPQGRPTLSPSILKLTGCRCHFWIRDGRVVWVGR